MLVIKGKGVYGAVAIGRAYIFKRQSAAAERISVQDTEGELKRVMSAKAKAAEQLTAIQSKALNEAGEAEAAIFELHIMMLDDEDYNESIQSIIKEQSVNAEYAVAVTSDRFSDMFANMDDAYMQARAADIRDISRRLISCLSEQSGSDNVIDEKMIVCADDLAPSETVLLDKQKVLAFATALGSSDSHTAILARNMNIPAVVGAGKEFLSAVTNGDMLIVDGHTGNIYIDPDRPTLERLKAKQQEDRDKAMLLQQLKGKENVTLDGTRVDIFANIGSAADIAEVIENDAGGIGLFRSEFLFLEGDDQPDEEQQFADYKKVLEGMPGKTVIIRTLDIGADKQKAYFNLEREENPALGLRAVRLCLSRPEMFKTQLRALYRASAYGRLGIMFPMITSVYEVESCLQMCRSVRRELSAHGIAFNEDTEIGIMIETPAAALISDRLAPLVDFFSVGTNDLIQYTLACDRQNAHLWPFVDTHHEAVMRLIELSAQNAHKFGKWIGICGELAADLTLTEEFLKMGINELSVSPPFILPLREKVRSIRLK